jgi:uncharacterized RmlC-like cupin family protein
MHAKRVHSSPERGSQAALHNKSDLHIKSDGCTYISTETIVPSAIATSVVAISRVRRLKRRDHGIHGNAANVAVIATKNQWGTLSKVPDDEYGLINLNPE